ncbi:MAG TPA: endolytic transglycosylase MltG [Pseudolysinimonas sp.]|nr:endolytic transglycosylase MltG [Pseudolysinimonas sp.]
MASIVALLVIASGVGAYGWVNYEKQIRSVLGWELPNDYTGTGNGTEVTVVIRAGDIGSDVAKTLASADVTMTYDAVYDYLVGHPNISFEPGNFRLQKHMSAKSAVAALADPKNRIISEVTIPEGMAARDALPILAAALELPVADLESAAADYTSLGIPANPANSIEGYLFPARYDFEPGTSAHDALQRMVNETFARLDKAGVAPADRYRVLTLASVVQRESGPSVADMHKIARVFQNRIDRGMRLQSDATVAYGTGNTHTVWTTKAERADASNLYNTYANDGLPVGPIGLPGDDAIDSALHPTPGAWLYFVPINLKTGETVFSETAAQHEAAAQQLRDWCAASAENKTYCT